jgi:hypothetical protein
LEIVRQRKWVSDEKHASRLSLRTGFRRHSCSLRYCGKQQAVNVSPSRVSQQLYAYARGVIKWTLAIFDLCVVYSSIRKSSSTVASSSA